MYNAFNCMRNTNNWLIMKKLLFIWYHSNYVGLQIRPDQTLHVCQLSVVHNNAKVLNITTTNKVIMKMKYWKLSEEKIQLLKVQ